MDLNALFAQHHAGLFRYLTRYTGDPEEAADAAQEAYLRLIERPPEREEDLRGWLFVVATNVVRDKRKLRHEAVLSDEALERTALEGSASDPLAALERDERRQLVRQMLGRLLPKEKTILLMREEGFAHKEIAQAVGTTTKSVGTMIARALRKLSQDSGDVLEELR